MYIYYYVYLSNEIGFIKIIKIVLFNFWIGLKIFKRIRFVIYSYNFK